MPILLPLPLPDLQPEIGDRAAELYGPPVGPPPISAKLITEEILRQTAARGVGKSICPSEVARALGGDAWRPLMTPVRDAALALARQGMVLVLRKGKPMLPAAELKEGARDEVKGVIRLAAPGDAA